MRKPGHAFLGDGRRAAPGNSSGGTSTSAAGGASGGGQAKLFCMPKGLFLKEAFRSVLYGRTGRPARQSSSARRRGSEVAGEVPCFSRVCVLLAGAEEKQGFFRDRKPRCSVRELRLRGKGRACFLSGLTLGRSRGTGSRGAPACSRCFWALPEKRYAVLE